MCFLLQNREIKTDTTLLFATFYEASMIPKKIGEKPIEFEVTIGELDKKSLSKGSAITNISSHKVSECSESNVK